MFVEVSLFRRQPLAYRMLLSVDQPLEFEGLAHFFEVDNAVFLLMMMVAMALALVLIKYCHSIVISF